MRRSNRAGQRIGWAIVCGVLLTACTSTGDISRNKPTFQGETAKLDAVYARCVQARWVAISPTARIVETPSALQVQASNANGGAEELLVVHSKVKGADVVLYEHVQILALRAYRNAVKACL